MGTLMKTDLTVWTQPSQASPDLNKIKIRLKKWARVFLQSETIQSLYSNKFRKLEGVE